MYHFLKLCKPFYVIRFMLCLIISLLLSSFSPYKVKSEELPSTSPTYTQIITHRHTGSANGGGCYLTPVTKSVYNENRCKGTMMYFAEWNTTQCNICGASYSGDESGRYCYTTNPETKYYTTYQLSCGHSDNDSTGTFSVTPDTPNWTKEVTLNLNISPVELAGSDNPFSINDSSIDGSSYTVTDNCILTASALVNENSSVNPITVTISNIDNTSPTVSFEYDTTPDIPSTTINVTATDLQPDQTPGCGLPSSPYSFDGGKTWTDSSSFVVTQNGEYNIMVKDSLDNIVTSQLVIDNIKIPEPPANEENTSSDDNSSSSSSTNSNAYSNTGNTEGNSDYSAPAVDTTNNDIHTPETQIIKTIVTKPIPKVTNNNDDDTDYHMGVTPFPLPKPLKQEKTVPIVAAELKSEVSQKEPLSLESEEESSLLDMLPLFLGVLTGLFALCALAFMICRLTSINNYVSKDTYSLKGFSFIHNKDGAFYLNISQGIIDKCTTNLISINASFVFCFLHKGDEMTVYTPDKQAYQVSIDHDIKLTLKSS